MAGVQKTGTRMEGRRAGMWVNLAESAREGGPQGKAPILEIFASEPSSASFGLCRLPPL